MVLEIIAYSLAVALIVYPPVYLLGKKVYLSPVRVFLAFEAFIFAVSFAFIFFKWFTWLFCPDCLVAAVLISLYRASFPAFYIAVFTSIPVAVALGAYEWVWIKNKVIRGFISVWIGAFVGCSWPVVFPWTLAGLLSLL